MTDRDGAEARPSPRFGRRGWILLAGLTLLVVVAAGLGGAMWNDEREPAGTAGPAGLTPVAPTGDTPQVPEPAPSGEASDPPSAAPLPPIPGTTVESVAAGWRKRWDTPPKASSRGYDTTAPMPGTGLRTRYGVLKSPTGDGESVATLFCLVPDSKVDINERFLKAVVDACLAPALRSEEPAALLSWLAQQDYSADVYEELPLTRFDATVTAVRGSFSPAPEV